MTNLSLKIIRGKPWLEIGLLVCNDILSIALAVCAASLTRILLIPIMGGEITSQLILRMTLYVSAPSIIIIAFSGLYPGRGRTSAVELQQMIQAITLSYVVTALLVLLQVQGYVYLFSRFIFILSWLIVVIVMPVGRFLVRKWISSFNWWGDPIALIGKVTEIQKITPLLTNCPRLGFRPVVGLSLGPSEAPDPDSEIPILEWTEEGQAAIIKESVSTALLTVKSSDLRTDFPHVNKSILLSFKRMMFLIDDDIFGGLWAKTLDISGKSVLLTDRNLVNPATRLIKTIFDHVLMALVLLPTIVLGLLLAIWIKLDSPGPVLYRQNRVGKNGKTLRIYKFRTMIQDADAALEGILAANPSLREEWETFHKLADDPRITKAGRWIRRFSMDELPQIINILQGEMSLIGPRPLVQAEIDQINEYAPLILSIVPGMSGWWQVNGRNNLTFEERTMLDVYYISNWSLWMDLFISIKTIWIILQRGEK